MVIRARFSRSADQPAGLQALTGRVEAPDGSVSTIELRLVAESHDVFEATFHPERNGVHFVSVWPSDAPQAKAKPATAHFTVASEDRERARPGQDRPLLNRLAAAGGGRVFDLEQLAECLGVHARAGRRGFAEAARDLGCADSRRPLVRIPLPRMDPEETPWARLSAP